MLIEIRDENIDELFEILCEIPMNRVSIWGEERPAGIEDIIDQLCRKMDKDEDWVEMLDEDCEHKELKEFSEYIDNVDFTDYGMTYNDHKLCICQNCEEVVDVIDKNKMWVKKHKFDWGSATTSDGEWSYIL